MQFSLFILNMLLRPLFLTFLCLLPAFGFAQIADDFSDGDFSANPTWTGDVANFIVNATNQLQLNAPAAGTSILTTEGHIPDSAVWEMDIRMDFAPSNGNFLRIYLQSDGADLLLSNAYYLQIGEDGSADAVKLFRQDAGQSTLLATGTAGALANNPNVHFLIKKTATGDWSVGMGAPGQGTSPQCTATDATYAFAANSFYGFFCTYSSTRVDKFFFDNIDIRPNLPDLQAPSLLSAKALDEMAVELLFDEALNASVTQNPDFFSIAPTFGQPASVEQDGQNPARLVLNLPTELASGQLYTLTASGFSDGLGNVQTANQTATFSFVKTEQAAEYEVLINEVYPDPSPSLGLPEFEFLELYNPTSKYIDLKQIYLNDKGGTPKALPDFVLAPQAYVVVAPTTAGNAFGSDALYWAGFPALNNSDDELTLSLLDGTVIDYLSYDLTWYGDALKSDGGYTLERINPLTPCVGQENWMASIASIGGTPGNQNSVFSTTADQKAPELLSIFPSSPNRLRLTFSEGVDESVLNLIPAFDFSPAVSITQIIFDNPEKTQISLFLATDLTASQIYILTTTNSIIDCAGNGLENTSLSFGLPEKPNPGDVLLNEILFNPASGGTRYVEIYNNSSKIIRLSDLFLANFTSTDFDIFDIVADALLLPDEYAVFTANPSLIETLFAAPNPQWLYQQTLPTWADTGGNATLYVEENGQRIVLDSVDFTRDFHNALLTQSDKDGVAIERIAFDLPTNDKNTWISAAKPYFGTPTGKNSASRTTNTVVIGTDLLTLPVARLSPDDDGFEDFLEIRYNLPRAGFAANITIYDNQGLMVKRLERQELVGVEGILRWEGDYAEGSRARPGIYILFFEVFHPDGTVLREKKTVAVVSR